MPPRVHSDPQLPQKSTKNFFSSFIFKKKQAPLTEFFLTQLSSFTSITQKGEWESRTTQQLQTLVHDHFQKEKSAPVCQHLLPSMTQNWKSLLALETRWEQAKSACPTTQEAGWLPPLFEMSTHTQLLEFHQACSKDQKEVIESILGSKNVIVFLKQLDEATQQKKWQEFIQKEFHLRLEESCQTILNSLPASFADKTHFHQKLRHQLYLLAKNHFHFSSSTPLTSKLLIKELLEKQGLQLLEIPSRFDACKSLFLSHGLEKALEEILNARTHQELLDAYGALPNPLQKLVKGLINHPFLLEQYTLEKTVAKYESDANASMSLQQAVAPLENIVVSFRQDFDRKRGYPLFIGDFEQILFILRSYSYNSNKGEQDHFIINSNNLCLPDLKQIYNEIHQDDTHALNDLESNGTHYLLSWIIYEIEKNCLKKKETSLKNIYSTLIALSKVGIDPEFEPVTQFLSSALQSFTSPPESEISSEEWNKQIRAHILTHLKEVLEKQATTLTPKVKSCFALLGKELLKPHSFVLKEICPLEQKEPSVVSKTIQLLLRTWANQEYLSSLPSLPLIKCFSWGILATVDDKLRELFPNLYLSDKPKEELKLKYWSEKALKKFIININPESRKFDLSIVRYFNLSKLLPQESNETMLASIPIRFTLKGTLNNFHYSACLATEYVHLTSALANKEFSTFEKELRDKLLSKEK